MNSNIMYGMTKGKYFLKKRGIKTLFSTVYKPIYKDGWQRTEFKVDICLKILSNVIFCFLLKVYYNSVQMYFDNFDCKFSTILLLF